eukprot:COSAG01_NODE_7452_length_3206_cov_3.162858_6_plen_81_part_00
MTARYDACRCVAPLQDLRQLQSAAVVRTHEGLPPHESAPNSTSGMASSPRKRPRAVRITSEARLYNRRLSGESTFWVHTD